MLNCNVLKFLQITSAPTPQKHEDHTSHESLVCDLDRNSHYDFRVAVLPLFGGVQKGYQSEWKNVSAYTEEDGGLSEF